VEEFVLKSITTVTKDGEWGKGEPFDSSVEMAVIRGTDFEDARIGLLAGVPARHIPKHIAIRKRLEAFDILIETAGGSKDRPTGRTLLVKPSLISKSLLPLTCASFARFIRIDQQKADPVFVFWLLQYLYNAGFILQYHTQHTGVARFQFTTFAEREPLLLPPIKVQKCIATVLSAYDDMIENNVRRIKILEEMAQMLYREWFVNFRYPGHENAKMVASELGPIPEGWGVDRLETLVDEFIDYRGKTPKKLGGDWSRSGILALSALNVKQGRLVNLDKAKFVSEELYKIWMKSELRAGDILMTSEAPLGEVYFLPETRRYCLSQRVFSIRSKIAMMQPSLLFFVLSSPEGQKQLKSRASGTTVLGIRQADLRRIPVVRPPASLQQNGDSMLRPFLTMIDVLQQRADVLRRTRDLLLPKLISGEVPVEAVNEAAAELVEESA
jgi:type I restriction enzyme S subunit